MSGGDSSGVIVDYSTASRLKKDVFQTLTLPQCLAEKHERPLYQITCGDMGTEPGVLEYQLQTGFLRAANWGAILLLEDVDMFFPELGFKDLKCNQLASIFLYHLGRSETLVLLTVRYVGQNLMGREPRIHLPLRLPDLSLVDQKRIWCSLIRGLRQFSLSESDENLLIKFIKDGLDAEREELEMMNGRQIQRAHDSNATLEWEGQGADVEP
ncbi:hypothetical protein B0H63DRAFT_517536 [Podospora didyma]|uniref:ATPase AAA-type core domain-containing protein n=1 Tax=Podospora didyma TaxID=330526 RepID=A0AAE0U8I1_9PEZI|nr:hypothetical protein B0H63DRAFT_517536 [Podospora didyma]